MTGDTIRVLDAKTANQIAAGEVVERPASVVKELVENAIDAGGKTIEVEITAAGSGLIRVTDDGCGMSEADAVLAVRRHATSKIRGADDLNRVATLGFRGEALASIASVTRFSLLTRRQDSAFATLIKVTGGVAQEPAQAGGGVGTTVTAADLFFNTPARKKFLKTPATENSQIHDVVIKLALSHPGIVFKLIGNKRLALATPGGGRLEDTLYSLYGAAVGKELLPLSYVGEDIAVAGFLSKPTVLRSSRQWQTYLVNGRIVNNRAVAKAVDNAYHSLLPKAGYPLAVVRIEVPPETIDVNVHPQKSEIKFTDESKIFRAVYKAVADAIETPRSLERAAAAPAAARPASHAAPAGRAYHPPPAAPLRVEETRLDVGEARPAAERRAAAAPAETADPRLSPPAAGSDASGAPAAAPQPLGQVGACYIVARDGDGLYVIDQHAAHERVLYDRMGRNATRIPAQQLLVHLFLDFTEAECALIALHQDTFYQLGFTLEASGPSTMRLTELPADIPAGEAEPVVREIVASLAQLVKPTAQQIRHACLKVASCRAAVKAGDVLGIRQMQFLIEELSATTLPYTCPHGRPTILKFSVRDLEKMFKRT